MTSFTNLTLLPKNDNGILFVIICHHNLCIFVKTSQLAHSLYNKNENTNISSSQMRVNKWHVHAWSKQSTSLRCFVCLASRLAKLSS